MKSPERQRLSPLLTHLHTRPAVPHCRKTGAILEGFLHSEKGRVQGGEWCGEDKRKKTHTGRHRETASKQAPGRNRSHRKACSAQSGDVIEAVTMETGVKAEGRKEEGWLERGRSEGSNIKERCYCTSMSDERTARYRPGTSYGLAGTVIFPLEACVPSLLSHKKPHRLGNNFQLLGREGGGWGRLFSLVGRSVGPCCLVCTQSLGKVLGNKSFFVS